MKINGIPALLVLVGLVSVSSFAQEPVMPDAAVEVSAPRFGPYEALVFNKAMVADVKVDEKGDVFLKLQPDKVAAQVSIKISMQKGAAYRKWFTGEETLMALQNAEGGRKPGVWSDRVQTSAHYIEYWADGKCFLHLKRTES
jgi:hypothetical protein